MTQSHKEECIAKSTTINKLHKRIGELERSLSVKNKEIALHIKAKQESEDKFLPVKEALNKMTAEHGKLKRKLKRKENKQ